MKSNEKRMEKGNYITTTKNNTAKASETNCICNSITYYRKQV